MLTWILIFGLIAAFSVAALELFREEASPSRRDGAAARPGSRLSPSHAEESDTINEADLDQLFDEFLHEEPSSSAAPARPLSVR